MNLESQVCSLELAKKLKELGVKCKNIFYWDWYSDHCYSLQYAPYSCVGITRYPAYTASELGEILPSCITLETEDGMELLELRSQKRIDGTWEIYYFVDEILYKSKKIIYMLFVGSESDARAKLLIHLLENKLIEL